MDEATRSLKEKFVSNLNGTTIEEIDKILIIQPLCILQLLLLVTVIDSTLLPNVGGYILELFSLVLPLILILTTLSSAITECILAIMLIIVLLCSCCVLHNRTSLTTRVVKFDSSKTYINWYRSSVNVIASICILAVDFKIYPRHLAKTENYGTGLMDIFVGAYILCNSLVCKEARNVNVMSSGGRIAEVFRSCLPLTILGLMRLTATSMTNYQNHVSEYGVHWNFFLTLAATRLLCTMAFVIISPYYSFYLAISCLTAYQNTLEHTQLKSIIMSDEGRDIGWILANKEGVFSLFGYCSLYFAGTAIGRHIFAKARPSIWDNIRLLIELSLLCATSYIIVVYNKDLVGEVSRRSANAAFIIWTIHHGLLVLSCMVFICIIYHLVNLSITGVSRPPPEISLLNAINYNSLLYFLLANVLTGLINLTFNTLKVDTFQSILIICLYQLVLNCVTYALYRYEVKTKFW